MGAVTRDAWASDYFALVERASYYRWCAQRGHTLPGNDPISGVERATHRWLFADESRAAYIAMARNSLKRARQYRKMGQAAAASHKCTHIVPLNTY